jgi:hypothetical protein
LRIVDRPELVGELPTSVDKLVGLTFGNMAYDVILDDKTGLMTALVKGCYELVPIPDPKLGPRKVEVADYLESAPEPFPIGEMSEQKSVIFPGTHMTKSAGTFFTGKLTNSLFIWGMVTYDDGLRPGASPNSATTITRNRFSAWTPSQCPQMQADCTRWAMMLIKVMSRRNARARLTVPSRGPRGLPRATSRGQRCRPRTNPRSRTRRSRRSGTEREAAMMAKPNLLC